VKGRLMPRRLRRAARAVSLVAGALALLAPAAASASPMSYYAYTVAVGGPGMALDYLRLGEAPGQTVLPSHSFLVSRVASVDVRGGGPTLGQPGAITGDADTAALFHAGPSTGVPPVSLPVRERYVTEPHFTFEAWVRPGVLDSTSRRIVSNEDRNGGVLLAARADGIVFSRYLNAGDYRMYSPAAPVTHVPATVWTTLKAGLPAGRYNHVVATYDLFPAAPSAPRHGLMRLYVNGVPVASRRSDLVPVLPAVAVPAPLAVGSNMGGYARYDGLLDELATYRATMQPDEVANHYFLGTTGWQPGP